MNTKTLYASTLLMLVLFLLACASKVQQQAINVPFRPIPVNADLIDSTPACNTTTPYSGALRFPSKYKQDDKSRSTISEEQDQRYRSMTKTIDTFVKDMVKAVDNIQTSPDNSILASCYIQSLLSWAKSGALEGDNTNKTGKAIRKWALASLAASYNRIGFSRKSDALKEIENWFDELAQYVIADYADRPKRLRNNHDYWAYWAVANVAVIKNDAAMLEWVTAHWNLSMRDVTRDGFLPNELSRKDRAREYHNFAIMPLTGIVAILLHNKTIDADSASVNSYLRLVERLSENLSHNKDFPSENSHYSVFEKGRLAWVPIFLSIDSFSTSSPYVTLHNVMKAHTPDGYSRLGGNTLSVY